MAGNLGSQLAPHLPLLRRHARALTGAQSSGDAFVRAALEALVAGETALDAEMAPRVALYRLFHRIWSTASVEPRVDAFEAPMDAATQPLDDRLARVTPRSRQAFLLTAMEGFTPEEAGTILDIPASAVDDLTTRALDEIQSQTSTQVLIIEDEPLIAMELRDIAESMGHTVTGVARTHAEALEMSGRDTPGLILSDIQLADGSSGLEATNAILEQVDAPVIFITAFPEQLLTGERPEPAFLITKPFNEATVRAAIAQSLFFQDAAPVAA